LLAVSVLALLCSQACSASVSEPPDAAEAIDAASSAPDSAPDSAHETGMPCADADGDGSLDVVCGGDDCDDGDPNRFPGRTEVCDTSNRDEDCDDTTFGARDADGDGAPDALCCNTGSDGVAHCGDDCDDASSMRHPGAPEACDSFDNDCDGAVDETVSGMSWPDADGDGFGDERATPELGCGHAGFATQSGDCDDTNPQINPSSPEVCNGVDDDCNGALDGPDEDSDHDGYADPACAGAMGTDCDDEEARSHPGGIEVCDGVDDDCDGTRDPPGACVVCGATGCSGATPVCCADEATGTLTCAASCRMSCGFAAMACDGPEDCGPGLRCQWVMTCLSASAREVAVCDGHSSHFEVECHEDADCVAPLRCQPSTMFPGTAEYPIHVCA
jgi:hypothetical protein